MNSGVPQFARKWEHGFENRTQKDTRFSSVYCQFLKMGSANVRLRHFVTGFSLSKGVRVMVECNPIKKKISAWQLHGEGIRSNFQPSREIKVPLKRSARDGGSRASCNKIAPCKKKTFTTKIIKRCFMTQFRYFSIRGCLCIFSSFRCVKSIRITAE